MPHTLIHIQRQDVLLATYLCGGTTDRIVIHGGLYSMKDSAILARVADQKGERPVAAVKEEKEASELDDAMGAIPKIVTVKEMPKPRRGRRGIDLTPLEEMLQDKKPHTFENITSKTEREKWARRVREAAARIGLEASTTYVEEESRLYFQGYDAGTAPARGRRSAATRKS